MDHTRLVFFSFVVMAIGCTPNANDGEPMSSSAVEGNPISSPGETLKYDLPNATKLEVLQEGKINEVADSFILVIGDSEDFERLAITILPAVETELPWLERARKWETGFLRKMSRKLLSEPAEFLGRDAYHVVAEAGADGDSVKIDAYFLTAGPWNYTVVLTTPSSIEKANEDLVAIRDSIQIRLDSQSNRRTDISGFDQ